MGRIKGGLSAPRALLRDSKGRFKSKATVEETEHLTKLEEALDRFMNENEVRIQFGHRGVFTIKKRTRSYTRFLHTPLEIWWLGNTDEDNTGVIIMNSRISYQLPFSITMGQMLHFNVGFPNYGRGANYRSSCAAVLNLLFAGVPIHLFKCGAVTREMCFLLSSAYPTPQEKITILP